MSVQPEMLKVNITKRASLFKELGGSCAMILTPLAALNSVETLGTIGR